MRGGDADTGKNADSQDDDKRSCCAQQDKRDLHDRQKRDADNESAALVRPIGDLEPDRQGDQRGDEDRAHDYLALRFAFDDVFDEVQQGCLQQVDADPGQKKHHH